MKKSSLISILSSILLTTAISNANAKTEGSYLGIDFLRSSMEVKSNSNLASDQANYSQFYNHKDSDSSYGLGVNYKYAFNFNNFFIAPTVSYNLLNNEVKSGFAGTNNNPYSQSMKLKSQLSIGANLGYDVFDQFAVYIPVGVSSFEYELKTSDVAGGGLGYVNTKKSGRESAAFVGVGFAYEPIKNWVVNLEYNKFQEFDVKSSAKTTVGGGQIATKNNIDIIKLGVAYKF